MTVPKATTPRRPPLYQVWCGMIQRCHNSRSSAFNYYGARGITVCDEWRTFAPFQAWAVRAGYQRGLSIDRIDNDAGYSPQNCRWATQAEQCRNNRHNVLLTYRGETKCVADWALDDRCPVSRNTLAMRLRNGWSVEEAIVTPLRGRYGTKRRYVQ